MASVSLRTLARSSFVAWLAEAWRIGSRFVLTPIVLSQIGKEGYGVWTLVFSVSSYVSMVNASFGVAYVRATAECLRLGERDRLERTLGSGMLALGAFAMLGVLGVLMFGQEILQSINVPQQFWGAGTVALTLVMVSLVLRMSFGCSLEILAGMHRMDIMQRLMIIGSILEFCTTMLLLWLGYGLVGMAVGFLLGQVAAILLARVYVARLAPELRVSPLLCSRAGFREVFSLGGRFQLLGILNTSVMEGTKIALSVVLGVQWVTFYDLSDKLLNLGKAMSSSVLAPLMPAFTDLQTGNESQKERTLFVQASRALALISCSILGFLAVESHSILTAWTNHDMREAAIALQILAGGEALMLQTGVVTANLRARGMVRFELTCAIVCMVVLLGLAVPLTRMFGFYGLIVARLTSLVIGAIWYMRVYFRFANIGTGEYVRGVQFGSILLAVAMASVVVVAGGGIVRDLLSGMTTRWAAAIEVAIMGVFYAGIIGTVALRWLLKPNERTALRNAFKAKLSEA
jgi:O-antigen/teichoic acid export membrane protein